MSVYGIPASTLLTWVNEIRIWAGVIAAAAAIFTGIAGYAQIRLQSVVSAEKDQAFTLFKTESAERIASAQAEAAKASAQAAALEKEAAQLNLTVEQERLQRLQLQNQMAWRRLSEEHKSKLVQALRGQTFKVWVTTVRDDPEARLFHQELFDALKEAGLEPQWFTGYELALGLTISNNASPERERLVEAFAAAGLPLSPKSGDGMSDGVVEITVGSKPPPF